MIELYNHNQQAYDAALSLMGEVSKAAVIRPTGTGKSFVGFKLAEQHPALRICWLPPLYITSIYSYQKDLEKCQRRVKKAKNKGVRDAAQKYLDELKPCFARRCRRLYTSSKSGGRCRRVKAESL